MERWTYDLFSDLQQNQQQQTEMLNEQKIDNATNNSDLSKSKWYDNVIEVEDEKYGSFL